MSLLHLNSGNFYQPFRIASGERPTLTQGSYRFIVSTLSRQHRRQRKPQVWSLRLVQHCDSILFRRTSEVSLAIVETPKDQLPPIVLIRLPRQFFVITNQALAQVMLFGILDRR